MLKDEDLETIENEYHKKSMILEQFGEQVDAATFYEDLYGDLDQVVPVVFIDKGHREKDAYSGRHYCRCSFCFGICSSVGNDFEK